MKYNFTNCRVVINGRREIKGAKCSYVTTKCSCREVMKQISNLKNLRCDHE